MRKFLSTNAQERRWDSSKSSTAEVDMGKGPVVVSFLDMQYVATTKVNRIITPSKVWGIFALLLAVARPSVVRNAYKRNVV